VIEAWQSVLWNEIKMPGRRGRTAHGLDINACNVLRLRRLRPRGTAFVYHLWL